MLEIDEYKLDGHDSVLTEDDVISQTEAKWFRRQVKKIAGTNPHGRAILEVRWGPTYLDPMSTQETIKYLDFVADGQEFGERRWFIEIWRSPEFLKRSGRYKIINDTDTVQEFYFCRACEAEIHCDAQSLEVLGSLPPCPQCGSKRARIETVREMGKGQLLQEFPAEGCYDYWLRLERANLTYHPLDREVLQIISALWEWEQLPQNQRDALEQADREVERRALILEQRRQSGNAPQFGSGLILPAHYQ